MPAGRPKGAKNKRPRGEEFVKRAALLRASARLKYVVPYDLDKNEKLDPMALLEEVMQHFYRKAKIECRSRQAGANHLPTLLWETLENSFHQRMLCERRRCLLPTAIRQVEPFLSEVQQVGFVIGT